MRVLRTPSSCFDFLMGESVKLSPHLSPDSPSIIYNSKHSSSSPSKLSSPSSSTSKSPWRWGRPAYFYSQLFGATVRIAYWDLLPVGCDGEPKETILLTHGEPSWSFLSRRMIDPLLNQNFRVVLFDQGKACRFRDCVSQCASTPSRLRMRVFHLLLHLSLSVFVCVCSLYCF